MMRMMLWPRALDTFNVFNALRGSAWTVHRRLCYISMADNRKASSVRTYAPYHWYRKE